jgi:hypothetical protein
MHKGVVQDPKPVKSFRQRMLYDTYKQNMSSSVAEAGLGLLQCWQSCCHKGRDTDKCTSTACLQLYLAAAAATAVAFACKRNKNLS